MRNLFVLCNDKSIFIKKLYEHNYEDQLTTKSKLITLIKKDFEIQNDLNIFQMMDFEDFNSNFNNISDNNIDIINNLKSV